MTQWPYDHFPTGGDEGGIPPIDDELRIHLDAVLGTVRSQIGSAARIGRLLALVDRLAAAERTDPPPTAGPPAFAVAEAIAYREAGRGDGRGAATLDGSLQPTTRPTRPTRGATQRVLDAERTLLAEPTRSQSRPTRSSTAPTVSTSS